MNYKSGVYFSLTEGMAGLTDAITYSADDAKGALPYGDYILQELPSETNYEYDLVRCEFSIYRETYDDTNVKADVELDSIVDKDAPRIFS